MESLRREIAALAARLIAEEGMDYGAAKRKAVKLLGAGEREALPDNAMVEEEVRAYQSLHQSEEHPAVVQALRLAALEVMDGLASYQPFLVGPVLTGTATPFSEIHIQLFCDSPKDVAIFLLNEGIEFEVSEGPHFRGKGKVEMLRFEYDGHGVQVALYGPDDLRNAPRIKGGELERADADRLRTLVEESAA